MTGTKFFDKQTKIYLVDIHVSKLCVTTDSQRLICSCAAMTHRDSKCPELRTADITQETKSVSDKYQKFVCVNTGVNAAYKLNEQVPISANSFLP